MLEDQEKGDAMPVKLDMYPRLNVVTVTLLVTTLMPSIELKVVNANVSQLVTLSWYVDHGNPAIYPSM